MGYLLKNKNYILVFCGRIISLLGDKIQDIGFMWYILSLTNSPLLASISLIVNFAPGIIFSPLAGIFADKYNRKSIMVICDLINGLMAIILGIFIVLKLNILYLFIITFLMSTLDTFFKPASTAIIPDIVKKDYLISANSLSETAANLINIVGPILGGILFALFNPVFLFVANGISFILSGIFEMFINVNYEQNMSLSESEPVMNIVENKKLFSQFLDGLHVIKSNKFLFFIAIIGGGVINLFLAPISLYIPLYTKNILNLSSTFYGIISSAITVGGLFGSLALLVFGKRVNKNIFVVSGFIFQGISLTMFGLIQNFIGGFISLMILGIALSITGVNLNTIVQEQVPGEILGRCMGVLILIANIAVPVGYFTGGYIIQYVSLNKVLVTSGIVVMICGFSSSIFLNLIQFKKIREKMFNIGR